MFIQAVRLGFPTASIMTKTASNPLSSTLLHGTTKADVTGGKPHSWCERSRFQQHRQIELRKATGSPTLRARACGVDVTRFTRWTNAAQTTLEPFAFLQHTRFPSPSACNGSSSFSPRWETAAVTVCSSHRISDGNSTPTRCQVEAQRFSKMWEMEFCCNAFFLPQHREASNSCSPTVCDPRHLHRG